MKYLTPRIANTTGSFLKVQTILPMWEYSSLFHCWHLPGITGIYLCKKLVINVETKTPSKFMQCIVVSCWCNLFFRFSTMESGEVNVFLGDCDDLLCWIENMYKLITENKPHPIDEDALDDYIDKLQVSLYCFCMMIIMLFYRECTN